MSLENVSVEKAIELMLEQVHPLTEIEEIVLLDAPGRILAQDMISEMDNPPFDRSPIDGYACHAKDVMEATKEHPAELKVIEEIDAGQYSEVEVQEGEAVRIMTGAAIPKGCDCCLRQEDTDYGEDRVRVYAGVKPWVNYCYRGEDFKKDTLLLSKGKKLTSVDAAVTASMGHDKLPVFRIPKIALLTSGDEVVEPGQKLLPGKIFNSNQTMLAARLKELGIPPIIIKSVKDDPKAMAEELLFASANADMIITTGGVSVGKKDIMHEALPMIGAKRIFWRVLLKPGTPTVFSVYNNIPVVSLSGNPFGAAANFELLIRPMLAKMMMDETLTPVRLNGIMKEDFLKKSEGRRFIRAIWKNGEVRLPHGLHSSGVLSSMCGCNCIVDIKAGTPALHAGDQVEAVMIN